MTVAMFLASKGVIPSKEYQHDPNITNIDGKTVCYYLFNNGVKVPEEW